MSNPPFQGDGGDVDKLDQGRKRSSLRAGVKGTLSRGSEEQSPWLLLKRLTFDTKLDAYYRAFLQTLESEDVTGRTSRWQLALSEYDLDIHHELGKVIAIAESLSRMTGSTAG